MLRVDPITGRIRLGGAGLVSLAASAAIALGAASSADAAVTSTFGAGSLLVYGDAAANTIKVTCIIGAVLIDGGGGLANPGDGSTAVACSSVTSIFVDGGDGPDVITLENLQTPQYPAAAAVSVLGGGANDTIRFAQLGNERHDPARCHDRGRRRERRHPRDERRRHDPRRRRLRHRRRRGGDDQLAGGSDTLPTTDAPDTIRGGTGTDRLNEKLLPAARAPTS
ncbi:MAG: hypothetical protein R3C15_18850 [Thermoleophilia bacterium]